MSAGQLARANPGVADYRVGAGDILEVVVYGHPEFTGDFTIGTGGRLPFPYCGLLDVADRSVVEVHQVLTSCLLDGVLVDPQVNVRVKEFHSQRVEVRGAVTTPGSFALRGPTAVRTILSEAGGVDLERSTGTITIVRSDGRVTFPVDALDDEPGSTELRAGDTISVDEGEIVLVGGQVGKPGPIAFSEGLTATEALLRAGDATDIANLAGSYVLRDGEKIEINLRKVRKGLKADLQLQPGDRLIVPESPI